ncbi:putative protein kinase RLK-Pelle-WAK family [Rosa chinensis]|uniref:Protein kinase domain-containing protein n=1 Tax=Rosa chinensis TaxID=74649 RepID=A0A2P6QG91_ROSCH|nr:wall-associated receptor kinase 2 [Rosa chinensis]PRQ33188.1 putative protein kinase RLK-Pelle-WAK family [Rosa chinensis]
MAVHGRMLVMQLIIAVAIAAAAADRTPPRQARPNCPDHCGNLTIPYPFGIGKGCFLRNGFNLTCNETAKPPTTLWGDGSFTVTNILLAEGELEVMNNISHDCYDKQGNQTKDMYNFPSLRLQPPFTISGTRNKFIAVGCDNWAIFKGYRHYPHDEDRYITGCITVCNNLDSVVNGSCSGIGCCQTAIPSGLKNGTVKLDSYSQHTAVWDNNPCSYAFIVEEGRFTFNPKTSFEELNNTKKLPVIINWAIHEGSCALAQNSSGYACKANSSCVNRTVDYQTEPTGYYCQCLPGFEGNPYLPDGCQDIDECMAPSSPCNNGICQNSPGGYSCLCNKGFKNQDSKICIKNTPVSKNIPLKISMGLSIGFFILVVLIWWTYCGMNKRRLVRLKEKYFEENGGLTLQQHLASHGGSIETVEIFTAEELQKATNNYHADEILGEGGYATVYKGIVHDKNVVAIKKPKIGTPTQSDQFVNEIIVLSQINHRNVVKLLGCCFETEVPLLVYEYITHGTLFEHVFNKGKGSSLSWELRLKIASETAGALAYLHSATSTPIIHRDVKTTNILLDDNYTAKVSDFGASRFIPLDQTQLSTLVQGTLGYLDPEYFHSNQLTEKSDVYSFGVVLAELLTSRVALSFARPDKERCLASFFVSSIENECLIQILDADIVNEENIETVEQVAILAKRCLMIKSEERPTMKDVAMELEGMRIMAKHPWKNGNSGFEETEYLLGSPNSAAYVMDIGGGGAGGSSVTNTGYDSMQIQMLMPYDDGR